MQLPHHDKFHLNFYKVIMYLVNVFYLELINRLGTIHNILLKGSLFWVKCIVMYFKNKPLSDKQIARILITSEVRSLKSLILNQLKSKKDCLILGYWFQNLLIYRFL